MLNRIRQQLANAPTLAWWGLAAGLYSFYLLGHNPVSNVCYAVRDTYTEPVYRKALESIGKVLLGTFLLWLGWQLTRTSQKLLKGVIWLLFGSLLVYYYEQMVKITIEYIHFIQYCGLTLVVAMALKGRIFCAMAFCLLAGFLDEIYQTFAPVSPLNWRDIGLNVTGVIWGSLVWWTLRSDQAFHAQKLKHRA